MGLVGPPSGAAQSLNEHLLRAIGSDPARQREHDANDFAGLETLFQAFFSSIQYQWHVDNRLADYEGYYASVFYSWFCALGLDTTVEDSSNGRLDMALRFNENVYLFEFKFVENTDNGERGSAMTQLKERGYADEYRSLSQPIWLIAVEFSRETRNVVGLEVDRG